jgi:putative lipoprotein
MGNVLGRIFLSLMALGLMTAPVVLSQETAAPAKAAPTMARAMRWRLFEYTCDGGQKLSVFLHEETVKVRFKDKFYFMRQVPSADGGRYSDGAVQWWGRGNEGFLQVDAADGNGAMIVRDCKLDKPLNGEAEANTVTGTVSYLQRIALPPTAVIQIQLLDVSLAESAAKVLAEKKITLGDRQVPVPFSLDYDAARIVSAHSYSVSARILIDGQLRFVSDKSNPVITGGNSNYAELVLKAAAPKP